MKRVVAIIISLVLLALIWSRIDGAAVAQAIGASDPWLLAAGLACVFPLTLATALRFHVIAQGQITRWESTRLILSASSLNLVLPSKMGDIAKSVVLVRRNGVTPSVALSLVVLEKLLDLGALLLCGLLALLWMGTTSFLLLMMLAVIGGLLCLIALLLAPASIPVRLWEAATRRFQGRLFCRISTFLEGWDQTLAWFWQNPGRAAALISMSIALWIGHLAQFWLFAMALGAHIGFADNMAVASLSILAGLLPLTFAGVGTRDAAILYFYSPWLAASQCAILGVLAFLRYVIPAFFGLPFMSDYLDRKQAKLADPAS